MSQAQEGPRAGDSIDPRAQGEERKWTVTLTEDPETGELILPIPDAVMDLLGVEVGDELGWDPCDGPGYLIRRIDPDAP